MPLKGEYEYRSIGTDFSYTDTHPAGEDAVVTIPAEEGKAHYITTILASFEADNQEGKLEVVCGGEDMLESFITGDPIDIEFSIPLMCPENAEIEFRLVNDSNNQATVFVSGFTRKV